MRQEGEQFLRLNGVRHWVKVAGARNDTIPLVVIHGGPGGNHYVFERTAGSLLEQQRTVVYYEQRGSGRSDPPPDQGDYSIPILVSDLDALLDALEVPQVDLLGYSFGGGLAVEYAFAHAARVRRLVLQAPALRLHDPQIVISQLAGFEQVACGDVLERIQTILSERLTPTEQLDRVWDIVDTPTIDRFLFANPSRAAWNREQWRTSGIGNTGDMNRALNRQPASTTAQHLHAIPQATLLLAGRHDRNVPLGLLREWQSALPEAELVIFEHSAHFPDVEETEAYAQAVLDFLGRTSPSRPEFLTPVRSTR